MIIFFESLLKQVSFFEAVAKIASSLKPNHRNQTTTTKFSQKSLTKSLTHPVQLKTILFIVETLNFTWQKLCWEGSNNAMHRSYNSLTASAGLTSEGCSSCDDRRGPEVDWTGKVDWTIGGVAEFRGNWLNVCDVGAGKVETTNSKLLYFFVVC